MLKPGVRIANLHPVMCVALLVAHSVFTRRGLPLVVTSGQDGSHMSGSLHYAGRAVDLRSPVSSTLRDVVLKELQEQLGEEFDVLYESTPSHFHIEWDP